MLGSHDSWTYLDAKSPLINRVTRFWRCQNKSIVNQYNMGVRFFDVRLMRDTVNGRKVWRLAHGMAELSKIFVTLKSLCAYMTNTLRGCKFRIWFEKGSDAEWEEFCQELDPLLSQYPALVQVYRKTPETKYYESSDFPKTFKNYQYNDWTVSAIFKNLFKYPIKNHASKVNPQITQEMIDDPDVCYFMDYVTGVDATEELADITEAEKEAIDACELN